MAVYDQDGRTYSDNPRDKELYLAWVKKQVENGLKYRDEYGYEQDWPRLWRYMRCDWGQHGSGQKGLPINQPYATAYVLQANIFFRNPHVRVQPRMMPFTEEPTMDAVMWNAERRARASIMEALLNWLFAETGLKDTMEDVVLGPITKGVGALTYGQAPAGVDYWWDETLKAGLPWIKSLPATHLVVPFGSRRKEQMRWFAKLVIRSLSDLKTDPRYETKGIAPTHGKREGFHDVPDILADLFSDDDDLVAFYEVHDRLDKTVSAFIPDQEKWLRAPTEDIDQIDGLPLLDLQWGRDDTVFWPVPLLYLIEPQFEELNDCSTHARDIRRRLLIRWFYQSKSIREEDLTNLLSGEPALAVPIDGQPSQMIQQLTTDSTSLTAVMAMKESVRNDIREIVGLSRNEMGQHEPGKKTATEARISRQGHEVRIDLKRDRVAALIEQTARRVGQLLCKYMSKRIVPVIGADALMHLVPMRGEELKDEFDYTVSVEEMTRASQMERRQDLIALLGQLGQSNMVNVPFLVQELLKQFDYLDVQQAFPQAGGMTSFDQFAQLQQPESGVLQQRGGQALQNLGVR